MANSLYQEVKLKNFEDVKNYKKKKIRIQVNNELAKDDLPEEDGKTDKHIEVEVE